MFAPVDLPRRIFRACWPKPTTGIAWDLSHYQDATPCPTICPPHTRLRLAAFEDDPTPRLVVDRAGILVAASAGARDQFAVADRRHRPSAGGTGTLVPPGRPSHRHRSRHQRSARRRSSKRCITSLPAHPRYFDVVITPVLDDARALIGMRIVFADSTSLHHLQSELDGLEAGAGNRLRRAAVDQRRTGNDQRRAAVDGRGARDDQRGTAVHQRRTRDDERGAAVDQRRAADDERRIADAQRRFRFVEYLPRVGLRQLALGCGRARSRSTVCRCGTGGPKTCGACAPTKWSARSS